jgi:dolichol kinase
MKNSKHHISSKFVPNHKISLLNKKSFKSYQEKISAFFRNFGEKNVHKFESKMFPSQINRVKDKLFFSAPKNIPQIETKSEFNLEATFQGINYKKEVLRKSFHMLTILILPISYIFLEKRIMLMAVLPISILIITTDHFRHKIAFINKIFYVIFDRVLRESELKESTKTGASYTAMAAILVFLVCPKIITMCAFSILAISDGLATLIGKRLVSKEFFEKSVAGSSAFGISALVILIICGMFTNQEFGFYLFGVFAVFSVTILEARPSFIKINDNFLIPVAFSIIMFISGFVWNINY